MCTVPVSSLLAKEGITSVEEITNFIKNLIQSSTLMNMTYEMYGTDCSTILMTFTYMYKSDKYGLVSINRDGSYYAGDLNAGANLLVDMRKQDLWNDVSLIDSLQDLVADEI
jgi:hypothetical protein